MKTGRVLLIWVSIAGEDGRFSVDPVDRTLICAKTVQAYIGRRDSGRVERQVGVAIYVAQRVVQRFDGKRRAVLLVAEKIPSSHLARPESDDAVGELLLQPKGIHAKHVDAGKTARVCVTPQFSADIAARLPEPSRVKAQLMVR